MNDNLIAAIINARVMEAHVTMEAMRTANICALHKGEAPTFDGSSFRDIIEDKGIHHNAIHTLLESRD